MISDAIGSNAWSTLLEDENFQKEVPTIEAKAVIQEYTEGFPSIAQEIMGKPANILNILEAKVQFLEHAVSTGFGTKFMEAAQQPGMITMLSGMMEGLLSSLIEQVRNSDLLALIEEQGRTEDEVLSELGINEDISSMSIGDFYQKYPSIIIKNTG